MKAVSLTARIKYLHCDGGDEGAHGILILEGSRGYPTKAVDINDQADFRFYFKQFVATEEKQREVATRTLTTA